MNFFCRIFGHTWSPAISAPEPRWNTTKDMQILASSGSGEAIRHFDKCIRCSEERELPARALDVDQPHEEVLMDPKDGESKADEADDKADKADKAESA
jgi:hypothetical protein